MARRFGGRLIGRDDWLTWSRRGRRARDSNSLIAAYTIGLVQHSVSDRHLRPVGLYRRPKIARNRCPYGPGRAAGGHSENVLTEGVALASVGVVVGLVISASTASVMASLLYGVRPRDPAVFLIVPLLLFAIAVLASYLPARRATKVDPLIALREA